MTAYSYSISPADREEALALVAELRAAESRWNRKPEQHRLAAAAVIEADLAAGNADDLALAVDDGHYYAGHRCQCGLDLLRWGYEPGELCSRECEQEASR